MTVLNNIVDRIVVENFNIPILQTGNEYFPDFLKSKLDKYIDYYRAELFPHVDNSIPFEGGLKNAIIDKIVKFSNEILKSVNKYYDGNILEATETFNKGMEEILFKDLGFLNTLNSNTSFYRARKNENKIFVKEDLFHIKYELRHIVSTNRYSVPGFPALYLGDSSYTCWEELGQYKFRDLYFSRFVNTKDLKIIHIEKIEDLLEKLVGNSDKNILHILSYFVLFPLTIACSIKVKFPSGNFKPEYIIPQLLLQYISKNDDIDGLKYLSTRIDYSKLTNVTGYNYVFPVKAIEKVGFCKVLKETFHCTEPTSLELEEIINNPIGTSHSTTPANDGREIELINGIKSKYLRTSFGKIEYKLLGRETGEI